MEDIEKYDGMIVERGVKIPNSLILHSTNPHKREILSAYYELNQELGK